MRHKQEMSGEEDLIVIPPETSRGGLFPRHKGKINLRPHRCRGSGSPHGSPPHKPRDTIAPSPGGQEDAPHLLLLHLRPFQASITAAAVHIIFPSKNDALCRHKEVKTTQRLPRLPHPARLTPEGGPSPPSRRQHSISSFPVRNDAYNHIWKSYLYSPFLGAGKPHNTDLYGTEWCPPAAADQRLGPARLMTTHSPRWGS
ncbi:hypothetical protein E2C01_012365 [Portunus trituberculatus]|uniref:Uncharacterized protein n=1 Tax=Portunus trituberculatus TaxID=210409 RepID=A0A5B7DDN4_PORTR|nr:hypothetical protein [Portunus trituberculatus]